VSARLNLKGLFTMGEIGIVHPGSVRLVVRRKRATGAHQTEGRLDHGTSDRHRPTSGGTGTAV
jgi:hypothetical protein